MIPSAFISHGAPDRVISASSAREFLAGFGELLPGIEGIVVLSAHWQTRELTLSCPGHLSTLHDFAGFPRELYRQSYPAFQSQSLTSSVIQVLEQAHLPYQQLDRGLDHGAWSVLSLAYPKADIPVLAMSLPRYGQFNDYWQLGRALGPLRNRNVLVLGSGGAIHNLGALSLNGVVPGWARQFKQWLHTEVAKNNGPALTNLYQEAPHGVMAHPTPEHYVPLLVAMGAAENEPSRLIHDSDEYGSLNNSSWLFGTF